MVELTVEAKTWSIDDVFQWASKSFGPVTADKLKKNEVDGEALFMLEYKDFYHMQIPAGPRRKILSAVAATKGITTVSSGTFLPSGYKPFTVLKNLITEEDVSMIRNYFGQFPPDPIANGSDYAQLVVNERLYLPSLEARLNALFPNMMIFATNFFGGQAENGAYSGWHTGVNLSKLFINEPETFTIWIPLQPLTEETGGRLWFYHGEYLNSVVDLLKVIDKKNHAWQYYTLMLLDQELEKNKVTDDCAFGDGFMFWEINPHCVDKTCKVKREVLSVRMISRDAVVDHAFLKELEEVPEGESINLVENKEILDRLLLFLRSTKGAYDRSLEIEKEKEAKKADGQ